jgi:hypothetical protein
MGLAGNDTLPPRVAQGDDAGVRVETPHCVI